MSAEYFLCPRVLRATGQKVFQTNSSRVTTHSLLPLLAQNSYPDERQVEQEQGKVVAV
jgi:hypothetical protein